MKACKLCGAAVLDAKVHDRWHGNQPDILERTVAAQQARMERDQRAEPSCVRCLDRGVFLRGDGTYEQCDHRIDELALRKAVHP